MAKMEVKMAVDPFRVISAALKKAKRLPRLGRLVSIDYDEQADVLYARFTHARIVDSKALDENGTVIASLDSRDRVVGLVVIHASALV